MKSLPGVFCILAAAAFAKFPTHCDAAAPPTQAVTIQPDMILIHPGAKLSKPDQKALNQILAKYDKSLYKIQMYKNGKVTRTQGQLSDMLIDKTLAAEAADAKSRGYSNRTLQIIAATTSQRLLGTTTNPQQTPGTTTNPQNIQQTPGATTNPQNIQQTPGATTNPQNIQQTPGATTNPQNIQQTPGATTNPQNIQRTPGATTNPQTSPSATTNPQTTPSATTNPQQQSPSPSPVGEKAARELIERLKPILEKYSRK